MKVAQLDRKPDSKMARLKARRGDVAAIHDHLLTGKANQRVTLSRLGFLRQRIEREILAGEARQRIYEREIARRESLLTELFGRVPGPDEDLRQLLEGMTIVVT